MCTERRHWFGTSTLRNWPGVHVRHTRFSKRRSFAVDFPVGKIKPSVKLGVMWLRFLFAFLNSLIYFLSKFRWGHFFWEGTGKNCCELKCEDLSYHFFFYGYVKTHAHCVKGAVERQSSPICLVFPIIRPYLLWNLTLAKKLLVNDIIHSFVINKYVSRALYLNLQTTEINFEKLLGWIVFKNQLQSLLIFFNLAHPCLLLKLLCYLNLSSLF